ncbi:sulfotransferase family protein [Rhodovibrionaceae bacterium A322]
MSKRLLVEEEVFYVQESIMPLARELPGDAAAQPALAHLSKLLHIVGVGVEKSGSSTVHDLLASAADVAVPVNKETAFFNENLEKGAQWYARQYRFMGHERAFLDFTPGYFRDAEVLEAIREFPTEKRIIVMLRNPVERAFSFYHHDIHQHLCRGEPVKRRQRVWQLFEEPEMAFSFENMWHLRVPYYFGLMATRLETIYQMFGADKVMVIPLEALVAQQDLWLDKLEAFLGVDLSEAKNRQLPHANPGRLAQFEKRQGEGKDAQLFLIEEGEARLIATPDESAVDAALSLQSGWTRELDPDFANEVFHARFREDVDRMADLTGLDLSIWEKQLNPAGVS